MKWLDRDLLRGRDKSSRLDIPLEVQQAAWNDWNTRCREAAQGEVSHRQADCIEKWLGRLSERARIIDIGCGTGWMSERLAAYGAVTGIDLADEVVARARQRAPMVRFRAGNFMECSFREQFDIAVSLEVLSHIVDQADFVRRVAAIVKPGGFLMLATQNKPVLERARSIPGPIPGQVRHWVNAKQLRALLEPYFEVLELTSVMPVFGSSYRLHKLLEVVFGKGALEKAKEKALLGHTLMALAKRRPRPRAPGAPR